MGAHLNLSHERNRAGAVFLRDIIGPLKFYAQALSGKKVRLSPLKHLSQSSPGYRYRPPFADGEQIFLPEVYQEFSVPFMNFMAFKISTAHQIGFSEFGTYAFQLSSIPDLFPPAIVLACLRSIYSQRRPVSPLEIFFRLFPDRKLARDLFQILEGVRIDHCLGRAYRGLKKEMLDFCQTAIEVQSKQPDFPRESSLFIFMKKSAFFCQILSSLPRSLLYHFMDFLPAVSPLLEKEATVEDAARTTVTLYQGISSKPIFPLKTEPDGPGFGLQAPFPEIPFDEKGTDPAWPGNSAGEESDPLTTSPSHPFQFPLELLQRKLTNQELSIILNNRDTGSPLSTMISGGGLKETEIGWQTSAERLPIIPPLPAAGGFKYRTGPSARKPGTRPLAAAKAPPGPDPSPLDIEDEKDEKVYYYDEWDYRAGDYRPDWCRVKEKSIKPGSSDFIGKTLESYAGLVAEVRRQFQRLKPEYLKKIHRYDKGDEIDLDAAIEAAVDSRAGHSPSEKIYVEKLRKERSFSTLFLLDISASTAERADGTSSPPLSSPPASKECVVIPRFLEREEVPTAARLDINSKRVIDVEKEALAVMAEALGEIGDDYAIFGFSSNGRLDVELYVIKDFDEDYHEEVKRRIDGIQPRHSTRMGPALRHALSKISGRGAKTKTIILISDGYPQDRDYGEDRQDREYGLYDTKVALKEVKANDIHSFCLTVDLAGNDYLRKICTESEYLVIEEVTDLPRVLPKIYRRLTT
ncbi:MAG: VWA domain-containing protein [Deltaproteobacteria bacterium]|nr:VWA domain-containing protein [Deltaproteobacteria bacterium]